MLLSKVSVEKLHTTITLEHHACDADRLHENNPIRFSSIQFKFINVPILQPEGKLQKQHNINNNNNNNNTLEISEVIKDIEKEIST
jgi:hypothetical protein